MFRRLLFVATAATVALAACSSGAPAAPPLTDPKEILTKSALTIKDMKTLHVHADVSGQVKLDLTNSGNPGSLDLKGTTGDGDIDIPNKKIRLSFAAPAIFNLTGDIIIIDATTYQKISLLSTKYTKKTTPAGATSAPTDPQTTIDAINKFLNTPGVAPTKQADEKCGDKDCYHVSMNLTSEQLSGVTSSLSSAAPTGTGTLDVWVQKNDLRPAKIAVAATAGDTGTVNVTVTFSNYDAPVTITAPADSDIQPEASPPAASPSP